MLLLVRDFVSHADDEAWRVVNFREVIGERSSALLMVYAQRARKFSGDDRTLCV